MTGPTLPEGLPVCGAPAARRVEVYTPAGGRAHGSLDASLYVCVEHHAAVRAALAAAGLTPYTVVPSAALGKHCGDGYDFTTMRPVNAPEPADDPTHGNSGPGGPLPAAPPEDDGPEYQVVVRDEPDDSYVDVVRDGAVIVRWTFDEACQVAQQLADLFGTFTGPASAPHGGRQ